MKQNKIAHVMKVSAFTNITLAILKVVIGFFGKSGALIADGIHSFSDLVTDGIVIVSSYFSQKPADKDHPYGHGRIDYIISILISLVIMFIGIKVINEAFTSEIVKPALVVAFVSGFTIFIKLFLAKYIYEKGIEFNSNVLKSSGKESKADVVTSFVVLIASIFMYVSDIFPFLKYANMIAMIIVGAFVIKTGIEIFNENISILIGSTENDPEFIEKIEKIINKDKEVLEIDEMSLIQYGTYYHLICELKMNGKMSLYEAHEHAEQIEENIKKKEETIEYVTIHINPFLEK